MKLFLQKMCITKHLRSLIFPYFHFQFELLPQALRPKKPRRKLVADAIPSIFDPAVPSTASGFSGVKRKHSEARSSKKEQKRVKIKYKNLDMDSFFQDISRFVRVFSM